MEKVFTITKHEEGYNIVCKNNMYSRYAVKEKDLYNAMNEISDVLNNIYGVAVLFEVQGL